MTPDVASGTLRRDGVQVTGLGGRIAGTVLYLSALLETGHSQRNHAGVHSRTDVQV